MPNVQECAIKRVTVYVYIITSPPGIYNSLSDKHCQTTMSILGFVDSNQILIRIQSSQVTKTLIAFHEHNNTTLTVGVATNCKHLG